MTGRRAAFFDIDRTLIASNTGNLYMRWRFRRGEASLWEVIRVMKWMLQYTVGVRDTATVTAKALTLVKDLEESAFLDECQRWFAADVVPRISDAARAEVERCQREGYECVILSAATPYVAGCVAEEFGIETVLCSRLEVVEGRFTGALSEPLCYGPRKAEVAESWAEANGVSLADSAFYTDSISDLPMLQRVGQPVVINPDPRLRWHARREAWPVRHWAGATRHANPNNAEVRLHGAP